MPKPQTALVFRLIKWAALGLSAFFIFALCFFLFYLISTNNSPSGKRVLHGLSGKVNIDFDASDIPHIKASTPSDALFALGFLHATERSWQMEINRRLAAGRLSEILGPNTLKIDRFIRTVGLKHAAEKQFDRYPVEGKRLLQAYADGVNAGNAKLGWALPIEYALTQSKPGHWSPTDSVAWMLMMAMDLGGNWQKELQRLELSRDLTTAQIWQVLPPYTPCNPVSTMDFAKLYHEMGIFAVRDSANPIKPLGIQDVRVPSTPDQGMSAWLPGGIEGIGSNNWALSGKLTSTGKPLLANDPHLGLSAPALWYFAHLEAPGLNAIGATLPGIPAVVLGRTDRIAWSFTNTGPDVQDLFIEQLDPQNPGYYRTPEGMTPFWIREEVIEIKNNPPHRFIVKESRHGPIISDTYDRASALIDTKRFALALRWTALDLENQSVMGLLEMNRATSLDAFKAALRKNHAPMQSVVMADTEGNIAMQVAGVAPKRTLRQGLYGVAPAPGWEKQYDWNGYVPFEQLPSNTNPEQGWIATANQQIIAANDPNPLTGDWELPFRYERITELIEAKPKHDLESMRAMQGDTLSLAAKPLLALFKSSQSSHPNAAAAQSMIADFNGDMRKDSSAALLFNAWADQLTRQLFSRLGKYFTLEYGKRHFRNALLEQLANPNSPWCDSPTTTAVETCAQASNLAMDQALDYLSKHYGNNPAEWKWGDAHIAISEHRPFSRVPLLNRIFNITTPFPGDGFTVNVGRPELGNRKRPFETKQAPSLRTVFDLADLERSTFIYQTGQSGWVQSKLYRNLNPLWAENQALPLQMKPKDIGRQLELSPK
ncbi:MAG: penicillin acylase family protein [Polynucleobacter sp.]|nr:penicillin acylase family protein [Polynucleobacter sp.]